MGRSNDFRVLPTAVIGNIHENLVPGEEKQKFGQYFTPETLANLVAFPAVYDVELISALFNSAITFLTLEMCGTSRNLGALDLNANYLKRLKILNPDLLSAQQKVDILAAFQPLKHREVETIFIEVKRKDRINFDKTILRSFGIDEHLLDYIYSLLTTSVFDRISMQDR